MNAQARINKTVSPKEQRRTARDLVDFPTRFTTRKTDGPMRVINISPQGLMGRTDRTVTAGENMVIDLPHLSCIVAEVRWIGEGRVGVEFLSPVGEADYEFMLDALPKRQQVWES
jgi:hypothetical protein